MRLIHSTLTAWFAAGLACAFGAACGGQANDDSSPSDTGTGGGRTSAGGGGHAASSGGGRAAGGSSNGAGGHAGSTARSDGCPSELPATGDSCAVSSAYGVGASGVCSYNGYADLCYCMSTFTPRNSDAGDAAAWSCVSTGLDVDAGGFQGGAGWDDGLNGAGGTIYHRSTGAGGSGSSSTRPAGAGGTTSSQPTGSGGSATVGGCPATVSANGDCTGYDGFYCSGCTCAGGVWTGC